MPCTAARIPSENGARATGGFRGAIRLLKHQGGAPETGAWSDVSDRSTGGHIFQLQVLRRASALERISAVISWK